MIRRGLSQLAAQLTILSLVLVLSSCQGCPPITQATITYEQVGACQGLSNQQGVGQSNLAFVFFRITGIDNTKTGKAFNFKPAKLYLNTGDLYSGYQWIATAQYSLSLGLTSAKSHVMAQGSALSLSEYAVFLIETQDQDGEKEATSTSYFLLYKGDQNDPGVLLVKSNSNQTNWPYTKLCQQIAFPK